MTLYDFNKLERTATTLVEAGRVADAIKVYLFMSDGDSSLDARYLGERLGICYETMGDLHAAKYWYGRGVEENPEVRLASEQAFERLRGLNVNELIAETVVSDPAL